MTTTPPPRCVCVTGAGGFIGSWLVKLLLSRGYAVHGTVRDPNDPKNAFLKRLDRAPENLRLFKADVRRSSGARASSIRRLRCQTTRWMIQRQNWYSLAKTEAEEISLKYAEKNGRLHVVTLLPCLVVGPLLQTVNLNTTSKVLLYMIKGGPDIMMNKFWPIVDVRDVADAAVLVYDKQQAVTSERYICSTDQIDLKDVLDLMKSMYPNYSYADKIDDVDYKVAGVTSEKLKNVGWSPRKLEETIADSIESYDKAGLLDGKPRRLPYGPVWGSLRF
ncbi:hypothetical protein GUJ93_ZPchr0009g1231 [Zizania palustris]|uniref:NAD-dependent epimerase/dehydratase domain-containing protein n=1 Tax=Zizania palustris TaxID=103762 RepID=A0A8J5V370_ZIZPA|nr:hypothetical protein GUJ93_ZPchr0009g1231 [Zizania palustris]